MEKTGVSNAAALEYDASPAKDRLTNPIDGSSLELSSTSQFRHPLSLLDTLERTPNFAVRRGEVVVHGWKLGERAFKNMIKSPRAPAAGDAVPIYLRQLDRFEERSTKTNPLVK